MNKFTATFSALILTAGMAWGAPHLVMQTSDGFLNVRSGPGTEFNVVTRVYPGDEVDTIEKKGRWYRVRLPRGGTGWVSGRFLDDVRSLPDDIRVVLSSNDGFLNLRAGPGVSHRVLKRIYPGNQVQVDGQQGNWLRVRVLKGGAGWVHKDYVR